MTEHQFVLAVRWIARLGKSSNEKLSALKSQAKALGPKAAVLSPIASRWPGQPC